MIVPSVFPDDALRQFDARPKKVVRYQGFKEELYLADFRADATVLEQLALDPRKVIAVFRPPPEGALYHRMANERFGELLRLAVGREDVQVSCFPVGLSSADVTPRPATGVSIPERLVDTQSLLALADLPSAPAGR